MKETIRDTTVIHSINPSRVTTYLRSKGWHEQQPISDLASVWTLEADSGEFEILLPLKPDLRDFVIRMSEVLQTLASVENRTQLEILRDFRNLLADIIRIRVNHEGIVNGSIPIQEGVQLFNSAKKLIWSAASSVVEPRPYFRGSFGEVNDYMRRLRIGPTEEGSYVLTIISPFAEDSNLSDSFERKVTQTLFQALDIIRLAPQQELSAREGVLNEAVQEGVSANLCEALSRMIDGSGEQGLSFHLRWSKALEIPSNVPAEILFSNEILPAIKEVKQKLKSRRIVSGGKRLKNQRESQEQATLDLTTPISQLSLFSIRTRIEGLVVRLEWSGGDEKAKVTVLSYIEYEEKEVIIELSRAEYLVAIRANLEQHPVICYGNLIEENGSLMLMEPRNFSIASSR
jgi:hypothetical protein